MSALGLSLGLPMRRGVAGAGVPPVVINAPAITANLALDLDARIGLTLDGSDRVSTWADQHLNWNNDGAGAHDAAQATAGIRPYFITDAAGRPGIMFPFGSPHPACTLQVPTSLAGMATQALTTYVVAQRWTYAATQSLFTPNTGTPRTWLRFSGFGTQYVTQQTTSGRSSNGQFSPPNNVVVYASAGRATGTVMRYNGVSYTAAAPTSFTSMTGANIGTLDGSTEGYSGIVYRMLVFKAGHSDAEMDSVIAQLVTEHALTTAWTKQIVCWGDSLTRGFPGQTYLRSYPFQVAEANPDWRIYEIGTGGIKLSGMDPLGSATIDFLFDAGLSRNVLCVTAGTNDIGGTGPVDGATTFSRLQTLLTNRLGVHAWETAVGTLPDRDSRDTEVSDYNALVRAGDPLIDHVLDFGKNSPIESRLNVSSNATYFDADQLHLTAAGYGVKAEYVNGIL